MGRELDKKKVDLSADGGSALMNALSIGTSTPTDKDYYICQWAGGGDTTTSYHRRSMSAMWNWIKSHADKIYAPGTHTHDAYTITSVNASAIIGTIAAANLPSYVDDVLEYDKKENFPATGESGKVYIDISTNKTYRWGGTTYVVIATDLALGETASTAYRGDKGKVAYDHASKKGSAFASNLYKITTNDQGHVTAAVAASASDIPGLSDKVSKTGDTITGNLTVSGSIIGNATSADKWAKARKVTFTGDVTGTVTLDGSSDVSTALVLSGPGTTTNTYGLDGFVSDNYTLNAGDTFVVPVIGADAKGRVTTNSKTISYKLPANTDTKITTSSANNVNKKLFLIGALEQNGNGVTTYSNQGNYIGSDNYLYTGSGSGSGSKKVLATGDDHSDTSGSHGKGTSARYGHVKLSDDYKDNTSQANNGIAASPYAVASGVNYAQNRTNATNTDGQLYILGAYNQSPAQYTYSNANIYIKDERICSPGFYSWCSGSAWVFARDIAALKTGALPGDKYLPIFSQKTTNGDWSQGVLQDTLYFSYVTDSNYNSGTNTSTTNVRITNAGKLYGAVWNDYAEYRNQNEEVKPGYCVASSDDGKVYKTTEKFQACDGIVSDTYGFAIGETDTCKTPLAVAGRVLAYCEGNRYDYHAGDTVCAGPEGKVVKMTREEIREWPDRIVGIVSEIPEYETWGSSDIEVDGRIWIKVK